MRSVILLLSVVSCLAGTVAQGQDRFRLYKDYDRYRYLPRLPQGNENPRPFPRTEEEVDGDPTILVDKLKGLIFVDHPDKVLETAQAEELSGIQIGTTSRLNLLRTAAYQKIARSYLGQPVSIYRLNELIRDTVLFYRSCDQPVVDVAVPEQDITGGVVQVVVTEARIGRIRVEGACYFDPQMLLDQVFLCPGQPIYESVLTEELRWLYRNPFRTVDLELTPGEQRGQTDVIFHVKDEPPWRFYTGYEDTGTRQTDLERVFAGVNWYNAFGKDDYFGYQYTANPQFDQFEAHSAFYSKALPNRDIVSVYGAFADYTAKIPLFGPDDGTSWQVLSRWYRELMPIGNYEHSVTGGFDFKQVDGALDFGPLVVFGTTFDICQFMAGYVGREDDSLGSWGVGLDGYFSPGDMTDHNTDARFALVRPGATADYAYARAFFERRFWMPRCTEFVYRCTGQLSEGALMPTEQLGFGGYNSVRGWDQYAIVGDSGYFMNLEYWSPTIPVRQCGTCDCADLRGLVFYDYGQSLDHSPQPGQDQSVDMHSVGVGVRYEYDPYFHLRFDYGQQLNSVAIPYDYRHRVHLGVVVAY